ncbi:RecT family recombinase [Salibacterium lacus]|uniref:RecT family recombinase n=1 Tax=Salibacterium lacus TaxID=1898109 RepID=A0ABW5T1W5_9BACI
MANNQIATQSMTPEINEAFKPEVLEVIRNSIAKDANDQEFMLFAHKAASYGLDPFKNEIFFIKYGNTARIQFAAEAFLSKAREKEGFQPPDTQMVHENDEFKVEKNKETGDMEVVQHDIGFPRGKIIGAYSIARREGHHPVTVIMDIDEISHMFTGQNKDNWNKWTSDMFGKHVQQRALKRQYGLEFDDETITGGTDSVPEYKPERKDITPNDPDPAAEVQIEGPDQEEAEQQGPDKETLQKQIGQKFKQLGYTNKEQRTAFFDEHSIEFKNKQDPTIGEMTGLIKVLDAQLEAQKDELE